MDHYKLDTAQREAREWANQTGLAWDVLDLGRAGRRYAVECAKNRRINFSKTTLGPSIVSVHWPKNGGTA